MLHYRAGNTVCKDGDLCLIDAACELDSYASDITRTFPVNGKFSGPQRDVYTLVLNAQEAAIQMISPGKNFDEPHQAAIRVLSQGLLDLGLLPRTTYASVDDVIAQNAYRRFYMHRTSHWLGLDVHDCGEYKITQNKFYASTTEMPWRNFETHMCLTIEPGLYIRPAEDISEAFWNIGIRIEDDVLVTSNACDNMTRDAPVSIDDIEALMR